MYTNDLPNNEPLTGLVEKIKGKGWEFPTLAPNELIKLRSGAQMCMDMEHHDTKWVWWRLFVAAYDGITPYFHAETKFYAPKKEDQVTADRVTAKELLHNFHFYIAPLPDGFTVEYFETLFEGWMRTLYKADMQKMKREADEQFEAVSVLAPPPELAPQPPKVHKLVPPPHTYMK